MTNNNYTFDQQSAHGVLVSNNRPAEILIAQVSTGENLAPSRLNDNMSVLLGAIAFIGLAAAITTFGLKWKANKDAEAIATAEAAAIEAAAAAVVAAERARQEHRAKLFNLVVLAKTEGQLTAPLNEILAEIRATIQADRVVIYRFFPNWGGHIVSESVADGYASAMKERIVDACIPQGNRDEFVQGRTVAHTNLLNSGYHGDHMRLFQRLGIRSNLVVPIVHHNQLLGLLVAHHCLNFHNWTAEETDCLVAAAAEISAPMNSFATLERNQYSMAT